jgi:pimeloyl-ACP methyl ester carboxylesterase
MSTEQTEIAWAWDGETVRVGAERTGAEPTVLLLPALSSISTRGEMRPLAERLAPEFTTVAVDWPGFGDRTGGPFHRPTTVRQLGPRRA